MLRRVMVARAFPPLGVASYIAPEPKPAIEP